MKTNKLIGLLTLGLLTLGVSTTLADSQIVIDPVTHTITIVSGSGTVSSGSTSIGTINTSTGTVATGQIIISPVLTGTEFQQALAWMYANGLTKYNTETGYRPNDFLTRQEAAKIIGQAFVVLGYTQETKNSDCNFSDANLVESSLTGHVVNACKRGLFKGALGKFMPLKALTRPETMAVLVRMFEGKSSNESKGLRWGDYYIKGQALGLTTLNSQTVFDKEITRYEIALYIYRLKNIVNNPNLKAVGLNKLAQLGETGLNATEDTSGSSLAADFSALAGSISVEKDPELQEAIRWMNDNSITSFKTIQEYRPFEILSREQAAKILFIFAQVFKFTKDANIPLPAECIFSDISAGDPALMTYVENACKEGIMQGSNKKFNPKGTIGKSEFTAALIRLFEGKKLDETGNPRWTKYFEEAQNMGIVSPADAITFGNPITRYEVALFLYRFKVKYQMIHSLNTNKLENEIVNTVSGSVTSGTNNMLQANVYVDMNLLQDGNFEVGYLDILGNRYKVVKSSTEKYFSNNFVRYGDIFDLNTEQKAGTANFIVSNGYVVEGTIRLPNNNYMIVPLAATNAYYQIKQIK